MEKGEPQGIGQRAKVVLQVDIQFATVPPAQLFGVEFDEAIQPTAIALSFWPSAWKTSRGNNLIGNIYSAACG